MWPNLSDKKMSEESDEIFGKYGKFGKYWKMSGKSDEIYIFLSDKLLFGWFASWCLAPAFIRGQV